VQVTVAQAGLGKSGICGYTLAMMNDAIKPAPKLFVGRFGSPDLQYMR
jgi:hypothetical protein